MRWANTATGEHMIERVRKGLNSAYNRGGIIADHTHFAQINAMLSQLLRQIIRVRIKRATRKDFIADHQHGGCRV